MKRRITIISVVVVMLLLLGLSLRGGCRGRSVGSTRFRVKSDERISGIHVEESGIAISVMLYNRAFGEFPKGDSSAIGRALTGANPLNIVLSTFSRISDDGAFLDPYGIHYDISISDNGDIQIRSAGVNKVKGDVDDEVLEDKVIQSEEWWSLMESAIVGSEIEQGWKKAMEASSATKTKGQ